MVLRPPVLWGGRAQIVMACIQMVKYTSGDVICTITFVKFLQLYPSMEFQKIKNCIIPSYLFKILKTSSGRSNSQSNNISYTDYNNCEPDFWYFDSFYFSKPSKVVYTVKFHFERWKKIQYIFLKEKALAIVELRSWFLQETRKKNSEMRSERIEKQNCRSKGEETFLDPVQHITGFR